MSTFHLPVARLLRSGTTGFVAGCRVAHLDRLTFGALVRVPLGEAMAVYGLIYDMHIDDDGLVRQLALAEGVAEEIISDNRTNRNVPVEISVLAVGYRQGERMWHLLPPRPPMSLDDLTICDDAEIVRFTSTPRLGYFRHVLRAQDLPVGDLLAAHIRQAQTAHERLSGQGGDPQWSRRAVAHIVTLLRDDYDRLIQVLDALGDALPQGWEAASVVK